MHKKIIVLTYNSLFSDYDVIDIKSLLKDIPSINALEAVSYLTAHCHLNEHNISKQAYCINFFIDSLSTAEKTRLLEFVKRNTNYIFINNQSSMMFDECLLENYNDLPRKKPTELTKEELLSILKLYLCFSQKWTDSQIVKEDASKKYIDPLEEIYLRNDLPISEFKRYKDCRFQLYKACDFFKFCEKNEFFKNYLDLFLKEKMVNNWQEYLMNILSFYLGPLMHEDMPSIIAFRDGENGNERIFLEQFIVDTTSYNPMNDFISLRNNFVLKINNNEYMILNYNLLVDKIYQGLQFDFSSVIIKNKCTYKKGKLIKNFPTYKGILGEEFSETYLFYDIMNSAFFEVEAIKINGRTLNEATGDREPDYYMRDNNKLFLFEFKDAILNTTAKFSDDINVIKDSICSKICIDSEKERKGGAQLLFNIDRFYNGFFQNVDKCDLNQTVVYPIIVVNDLAFDANGVSSLIDREFDTILTDKYLHLVNKVKKPVIINLDTFIYLLPILKEKKGKIDNVIDLYLAEQQTDIFLKYRSFKDFVSETYPDKIHFYIKDFFRELLSTEIVDEGDKEKSINEKIRELSIDSLPLSSGNGDVVFGIGKNSMDIKEKAIKKSKKVKNGNRIKKKIKRGKSIITKRRVRRRNRQKAK